MPAKLHAMCHYAEADSNSNLEFFENIIFWLNAVLVSAGVINRFSNKKQHIGPSFSEIFGNTISTQC